MFLAPFLVVYLAFVVYPVFSAARMSLYDWDLLGFTRSFIGLANWTGANDAILADLDSIWFEGTSVDEGSRPRTPR